MGTSDAGGRRRVLVVEDDVAIADAVRRRLEAEGYDVDVTHDGRDAVAHAARVPPDVVVLDVMLPGLDGLEVCRRVQQHRPVPVLMLTARSEETDRLVGLGVGADDYVTKPFSPRELVARVAALLRRVERAAVLAATAPDGGGAAAAGSVLVAGAVAVDVPRRRVHLDGEEVHLTRTEFDVLRALAEAPGAVVTRERLLVDVWGWPASDARSLRGTAARAVDSHVKALRRKLGPERIRTVTGVGYALEVPA
ncbi:response regulator transcription factor [Aquipuribacter nitratireducens]|uniref:Response regulator transcription factor n=1 Tax=Aquipuribacter nitratireducens TaxID=650104 RepID=A0ABW0GM73_9MICO